MEGHRSVGVEVLVEAEGASGPLPALAGVGLEHHLFAQRVDALLLLQVVDGCSGEVLVDEHAVAQPLVTRHGAQREAAGLVLQVEASVEQVASVAARLVVADGAYCGLQRLGLLLRIDAAHIVIRIAALVVVLVAQAEVEFPAVGGEQDAAESSAYALCIVHLLAAEGGVAEESALVVVVASGGEGEAGAHAVVVGERGVVVVARGSAQAQVGALVAEGRLGVDLDESAHGVAAIEGALRAAQHVDALYVGIAKVEGRLVDVGDVVHVEAYRGGVDARANAADIDGRGEARAIVGDEEVGHYGGEGLDAVDLCLLHLLLREQGDRGGLFAQLPVLLGGGDDDNLFYIHHLDGVSRICIGREGCGCCRCSRCCGIGPGWCGQQGGCQQVE